MMIYQLVPMIVLAGVVVIAFKMRAKLAVAAGEMYANEVAKLRADFAAARRPNEGDPACVVAMHRTMMRAQMFFVALSDQRLVVASHGLPTRVFDRDRSLELSVARKRFADRGNMQTMYSEGWEARVVLPGGESHAWRLYDAIEGYPEQRANLEAFLAATGAR